MPSQTEQQRQDWQESTARQKWVEQLLRRAQNQYAIETESITKIQTAINAAQTEVAAILLDIQANQAPEWRVRRAQQQVAALERLDGELRSKLLTIARAGAEQVKLIAQSMPQEEGKKLSSQVEKALSKLVRSTTRTAQPQIGQSAGADRGLVAIDARSVDIAVSFVPELVADQIGTLKKAVQREIVRNSLALTTPTESMARLTSVATPIGAFPTAAVRAEAIVRTEYGRVSNIAAMSAIQSLAANPYGLTAEQRSYMLGADGTMYKEWIAVGDHRTRPEHAALDGTIIPVNESFMVGEFTAQFPKDPSLPAKHAVNCRCMVVPSFPPEIAERLGSMRGTDGSEFADAIAQMQGGGSMVGTASAAGGESFVPPESIPPDGFNYDLQYDPTDNNTERYFVNQQQATSSATDPTAIPQPLTVTRGSSPLTIISGIQQMMNLTGKLASSSNRPSSLISFVRFATKILNTAQKQELLKPIPSAVTHVVRSSVDAGDFFLWLAQERGELKKKLPKKKKKVVIDEEKDREFLSVLPTPLIVATSDSITKLSPDEITTLVGKDKGDLRTQLDIWRKVLKVSRGEMGQPPMVDISENFGIKLTFDWAKWDAIPDAVKSTILRGVAALQTAEMGQTLASDANRMLYDLQERAGVRETEISTQEKLRYFSVIRSGIATKVSALIDGLNLLPQTDSIVIAPSVPDQVQTAEMNPNPQNADETYLVNGKPLVADQWAVPEWAIGTPLEVFFKAVPVDPLDLQLTNLGDQVVFKIQTPAGMSEADKKVFLAMLASKLTDYSVKNAFDEDAGTMVVGVTGWDLLLGKSNIYDAKPFDVGSNADAFVARLFRLPKANASDPRISGSDVSETTNSHGHWDTTADGELVLDLSSFNGNPAFREMIRLRTLATGKSVVGDTKFTDDARDAEDGSGRKLAQMHDLVEPPTPIVPFPEDGRIVGVENIFKFLYNPTGRYDASLLKTHYALGGWRLAMSRMMSVPVLVLPKALNSREMAVPLLNHMQRILATRKAMGVELHGFASDSNQYAMDKRAKKLAEDTANRGKIASGKHDTAVLDDLFMVKPQLVLELEAALPPIMAIARKIKNGEPVTPQEERKFFEFARSRRLQQAVAWASGQLEYNYSEIALAEAIAIPARLKGLGLNLDDDFALWRAEKLERTVYEELYYIIRDKRPDIDPIKLKRLLFGINGLGGGDVFGGQIRNGGKTIGQSGHTDALDLMQFAEERGVTARQIIGAEQVRVLRMLYDAGLITVKGSRTTAIAGAKDILGSGLGHIAHIDSGTPLFKNREGRKIIAPRPLGSPTVGSDALAKRMIIVADEVEVRSDNGEDIVIQMSDTTYPFRDSEVIDLQDGDAGFEFFLRTAAGNTLLTAAVAGHFGSLVNPAAIAARDANIADPPTTVSTKARIDITIALPEKSYQINYAEMLYKLDRELEGFAQTASVAIARDALNDPVQMEDLMQAVARKAVERGASPDDPLIAALLAIPRMQDALTDSEWVWGGEAVGKIFLKKNPELAGNPFYEKMMETLAGDQGRDARSPMRFINATALAESLYPDLPIPDNIGLDSFGNLDQNNPVANNTEIRAKRAEFYALKAAHEEKRNDFARRMLQGDQTFILRAIISRAYTIEQQRAIMGTPSPAMGQYLKGDETWRAKPVDVAWYEVEATLLETLGEIAIKNSPSGDSESGILSEFYSNTVEPTPAVLEALRILEASGYTIKNDEAQAAYDTLNFAAKAHATRQEAALREKLRPLIISFGYDEGSPKFTEKMDQYVEIAQDRLNRDSLWVLDRSGALVPAGADLSQSVRFALSGENTRYLAGMLVRRETRKFPRLINAKNDWSFPDSMGKTTAKMLLLMAKGLRQHVINHRLEVASVSRKQIVDALDENNKQLIGGAIKAAEWAAKARKLIREKRRRIQSEQDKIRRAARAAGGRTVSEDLYLSTIEVLDKQLEALLKALPKNKFIGVTDAAVEREIEAYRQSVADILNSGTERTIVGATDYLFPEPDSGSAKSLGSSSANSPWKGKWRGKKFIIKSVETGYKVPLRPRFGLGVMDDLWAEPAAQIVDELGGLFIRKAQARSVTIPDINGSGEYLSEGTALIMDWLEGYPSRHARRPNSIDSAENYAMMQIFDAIIGNTDRHGGNWLTRPIATPNQPAFDDDGYPIDPTTQQIKNGEWEKWEIVPIDNGLAFPDADVHLSNAGGNMPDWMAYDRSSSDPITFQQKEVLLRLWSNRSALYAGLRTQMNEGQVRGVFYRIIWMLRSGLNMDQRTFESAAYNAQSPNADEFILGAFDEGQSLLDANVAPVSTGTPIRQDPYRLKGQIPAIPFSDEPDDQETQKP